jgi:hypothetical protein
MRQLGVNAIRVVGAKYNGDHDFCMGVLADAGIYVLLDLIADGEVCASTLLLSRETW